MQPQWRKVAATAALVMLALASRVRAAELSPEETVTRYLTAMKAGKFADAYEYVSKDMAQGKSKEDWAKEQQWVMQATEAKIFEFKVYPGKTEGDKALVPNLLSSQDKYLNQLGVEEQELYTLIREDGRWKINQQQLVEKSDVSKWFPAPAAPQKAPEKAPAP
ncbi:MAG TPA: hypothetical protein VL403_03060 [Candidatus Kryptonia bacterium]|nr:hypothetical protein [Candidatus Kryptonia bacterium]